MAQENPLWITPCDELWITPMNARIAIEKVVGSPSEALLHLLDALKGGTVVSSGIPKIELVRHDDQTPLAMPEKFLSRHLISSSFWTDASAIDERSWSWRGGIFQCSAAGVANYIDVGFARVDVRGLCDELRDEREGHSTATLPVETTPPAEADVGAPRKGGRTSDKHGAPIAELAIRLYNMDDEFNRYTGPVVEAELVQAYRSHRVSPPSESNIRGISHGILRAVRAARGERT